jgi:hypothetical protein
MRQRVVESNGAGKVVNITKSFNAYLYKVVNFSLVYPQLQMAEYLGRMLLF